MEMSIHDMPLSSSLFLMCHEKRAIIRPLVLPGQVLPRSWARKPALILVSCNAYALPGAAVVELAPFIKVVVDNAASHVNIDTVDQPLGLL